MAKEDKTGKIILAISIGVLAVGTFLLLKPKKNDDESSSNSMSPNINAGNEPKTSTESGTMSPPPTLDTNTPKGSGGVIIPDVYSTANGAIMYMANMQPDGSAKVGAQIRSLKKGDKVGKFFGNREIQGYPYYLVTASTGTKVLIAKSVATIK